MKRRFARTELSFSILVLTLCVSAAAQNVTTTVHDYDSAGNQVLLRSDDYHASGQATYTTSSSKRSSLGSSILSDGEFELQLSRQSVRTVWITPNDPVGSQLTGPPAGYYWSSTFVRSHCFDQNGNLVPLANVVTYSGNYQLGVDFSSGGLDYKLLMSPFAFSISGVTPTCPSSGCPPTGFVTVTCNAVSNGQCVKWTITPNTGAANATYANLYSEGTTKKGITWN
jgi:hypothetical protein